MHPYTKEQGSMNRDAVFFYPHERKKIGRKYPPLLFPMFPFPLTEWKPVRGRIDVRFPRQWTTNQSRLPLSQIRYVILDLVADPVPGLHHRIFATIARWHSHARVHFHPEAFTHRRCKGSACATSFPPSALHQKGPVFFVLRTRWWNVAHVNVVKHDGSTPVFSSSFFRSLRLRIDRWEGSLDCACFQLWLNRSIVKDEWISFEESIVARNSLTFWWEVLKWKRVERV